MVLVGPPTEFQHPRSERYDYGMTKPIALALYIVAMIVIIVGVDVLFFRSSAHSWERLMVNVGIVLVCAAFYLRFLR